MCFHDIGPHRILQGQPLEVIGIVHPHVVGLILHHRKGPALHFEEVVGDLIEARRTEDIHLLSIQLPWLLQPQAGHPKAWVLSCFIIMVPLKAATLGYIRGGGAFLDKSLLVVHLHGAYPHGAIRSATDHAIHVFRGHIALSWKGVELKVLGDKAIGISRQGAIQVPKDARHLATVTEGALAAVEPSGTLISHGASCLKAPFKGSAIVQIDAGHT